MKEKKKMSLLAKQSAAGWVFLTPATILIAIMAFWPMVQAFIMSLQTGSSANLQWNDPIFNNYTRMFSDKVFMTSVGNTFLYLIIQNMQPKYQVLCSGSFFINIIKLP